jgi:hypothetical protein
MMADEKDRDGNVVGASFGGAVSPHSLLSNCLRNAEDFERVIVITKDKEGWLQVGWSRGSAVEAIGMSAHAMDRINDVLMGRD